jgi:type II secretory pathway pseudopilin PulG
MTTEVRSQKPEVSPPSAVGLLRRTGGQWSVVSGRRAGASCQAFTMIEIAISLAVIGFALVAILGVLPLGMSVQKENREETIINQDASVFLNAIRNGARGMDDLTHYVMAITNYQFRYGYSGKPDLSVFWYTPNNSRFGPGFALTNGFRIVGLLSTPKYVPLGRDRFLSNYVVAAVRSLSGNLSDKFPQTNTALQDLAFSYRMIPEVVTFGTSYNSANQSWGNPMAPNLQSNLHEVRLTFRWPLAQGTKAPGRQVYRAVVGGTLVQTNEPWFPVSWGKPLFFLEPGTYVQARIP